MSAQESRPAEPSGDLEDGDRPVGFTYRGSRVPLAVAFLWAVFFVWGVAYLFKWVPQSWREWFAR